MLCRVSCSIVGTNSQGSGRASMVVRLSTGILLHLMSAIPSALSNQLLESLDVAVFDDPGGIAGDHRATRHVVGHYRSGGDDAVQSPPHPYGVIVTSASWMSVS